MNEEEKITRERERERERERDSKEENGMRKCFTLSDLHIHRINSPIKMTKHALHARQQSGEHHQLSKSFAGTRLRHHLIHRARLRVEGLCLSIVANRHFPHTHSYAHHDKRGCRGKEKHEPDGRNLDSEDIQALAGHGKATNVCRGTGQQGRHIHHDIE